MEGIETSGVPSAVAVPVATPEVSVTANSSAPGVMTAGALALLTGIALLVAFSESMLIPALPLIETQYGATSSDVAWVPAIYLLVGAASVPLAGKLGDIYGRKRVLVVVMAIYSAGALGNGFSWSLDSLIFFRAVQGVGLAMFPLAFALIHDQMPPQRVPLSTGLVSGMNSIGSTVGLLGGALITSELGWQANYQILAPAAIALTILLALFVVEGTRLEREGIDYVGAALFAIGIGVLLVGVTDGDEFGWTSWTTISLFVSSAVFLTVFVFQELRAKAPLMNFRLPRIGLMLKTDALMFIAGAAFYLGFLAVIYFVQGPAPGFGLDVTSAALVLLPGAVSMIFFALLAGVLMRRYGVKLPQAVALSLFVLGFASLLAFHDTATQVALGFLPVVAGVAMLFNCVVNATMVLAPREKVGAQNGTLSVFQQVGQSIAAASAGAALAAFYNPVTGGSKGEAYVVLAVAGIVLALVGILFLLSMPRIEIPSRAVAQSTT